MEGGNDFKNKHNIMLFRNNSDELNTTGCDSATMLSVKSGGGGTIQRTQAAIYQPASGEKHVLFYPTSPALSGESEEPPHCWSQRTASWATITNVSTKFQ